MTEYCKHDYDVLSKGRPWSPTQQMERKDSGFGGSESGPAWASPNTDSPSGFPNSIPDYSGNQRLSPNNSPRVPQSPSRSRIAPSAQPNLHHAEAFRVPLEPSAGSSSEEAQKHRRTSDSASKHSSRAGRQSPATASLDAHRARTCSAGRVPRLSTDEALAVYQRSCSILQPTSSSPIDATTSRRPTVQADTSPPTNDGAPPMSATRCPYLNREDESFSEEPPSQPFPATSINWTSPSTRRREYAKIDRCTRGIRGVWRTLTPKWMSKHSWRPFYDGANDSEVGSVRRYRLELSDDEDVGNEKSGWPRTGRPALGRSWSCY